MKKIVSMALIAALIVSAAGCGEKAPAETISKVEITTTAETKEEITSITVTNEETTEITTTPEIKIETATTEEKVEKIPEVSRFYGLRSGIMTFDGNSIHRIYSYNISENKLYELRKYIGHEESTDMDIYGKIGVYKEKIYNLETGEDYEKTYGVKLVNNYADKFNPVYRIDEDFDGNTIYYGVIDYNGDWILPLSSEYDKEMIYSWGNFCSVNASSSIIIFNENDTIYNLRNNKTIKIDKIGDYYIEEFISAIDNYVIMYCRCYSPQTGLLARYNVDTGEVTAIAKWEVEGREGDLQECMSVEKKKYVVNKKGKYVFINKNYNKVDLNLSDYEIMSVYDFNENYAAFIAKNVEGDNYMIIADKEGKRIVEPQKDYKPQKIYIIGDYAVVEEDEKYNYIIDCKTGEKKDYEYKIVARDVESDMIIIEANDAYYLNDPADPDTLLNPFELVQG